MQKIRVESVDDGKKIATFISSKYPKVSINTIYKTLRKKDIKINGKRISENVSIAENDVVEIYLTDNILYGIKENLSIPVVYEDDNIIVFNKPSELEVEGEYSLTSIMKQKYQYIEPCHRIDRNTIGLVLFAKNEETLNLVKDAFKNDLINKNYIACCYGIPKSNAVLNAYLFKDRKKSIVFISKEPKKGYTKIETAYTLLDQNTQNNLSILKVKITNGKTHQIRAHLAFAGLPILGDGKYGSYEINKKFKVNTQLLCSYSISFNFHSDSRLSYLNEKNIILKEIPFTNYIKD